jgi:hypothetical protein
MLFTSHPRYDRFTGSAAGREKYLSISHGIKSAQPDKEFSQTDNDGVDFEKARERILVRSQP